MNHIEIFDLSGSHETLKAVSEEETFIFNLSHKVSYDPNHDIRIPAPSKFIPGNNPKPYSHKRK
jgi:hypothetical protein